MMLHKTAILYMIADTCIDYIYNLICKNFVMISTNILDYGIGEYINIEFMWCDKLIEMRDCKITQKNENTLTITCYHQSDEVKLVFEGNTLTSISTGNGSKLYEIFDI